VLASQSHLVLGTAGHIDHGKTSLVKALTGIDTDRLKEEKERGITIELGFAHMTLGDGSVVAIIDVPGHERFVRTMVAGAVGIDAVLLVVAADEGVMPQTREHLDICELLGLRGGVVALTKSDLVDAELRELARLELREALRDTFLASAPIVPCSARTGEGLFELRAAIAEVLARLPGPGRELEGLVRLPVDRVFALRGFGTVATGTLWSGRLSAGDELLPLPGPAGLSASPAKVRSLQVHGQPVGEAVAGQRTALNLAMPREALLRGDTLVRPGTLLPSVLIDAEVRYLSGARDRLPRRSRLLFHAAGAQRLCAVTLLGAGSGPIELRPGERCMAQIQLAAPLVLLPGDRFVLRGFTPQLNHGTTLGGGIVLATLAARHRRGSAALLGALGEGASALRALRLGPFDNTAAHVATLVTLEVERLGTLGASLNRLRMAVPSGDGALRAALQKLVAERRLVAIGEKPAGSELQLGGEDPVFFSRATVERVAAALTETLAGHHQKEPRSPGLSRATLRAQAAGSRATLPVRLFQHVLDEMVARGAVVVEKDLARLASHKADAGESGRVLAERIVALCRAAGLSAPRLDELPALLESSRASAPAQSEQAVSSAALSLVRSGALVRVKDLLFYREHVEDLRQRLVRYLQENREITPAAWKDLVGQSRKFTIPLAEHFDAEKLTLRVGDVRRLRGQ